MTFGAAQGLTSGYEMEFYTNSLGGHIQGNNPGIAWMNLILDEEGGNVGISNTSPAALLHVGNSLGSGIVMELQNSAGACTYTPGASSVTVSCSSDVRIKTDIKDSGSALAWADDMRVRDYEI